MKHIEILHKLVVQATVDIEPPTTTKQMVRMSRGFCFQPKKVTDATKLIRNAFEPYRLKSLISTPVKIIIIYASEYPKSWPEKYKTGDVIPKATKPDWDNASKLFCDALEGMFWIDDKQIYSGTMEKYYAPKSFVSMSLYTIDALLV